MASLNRARVKKSVCIAVVFPRRLGEDKAAASRERRTRRASTGNAVPGRRMSSDFPPPAGPLVFGICRGMGAASIPCQQQLDEQKAAAHTRPVKHLHRAHLHGGIDNFRCAPFNALVSCCCCEAGSTRSGGDGREAAACRLVHCRFESGHLAASRDASQPRGYEHVGALPLLAWYPSQTADGFFRPKLSSRFPFLCREREEVRCGVMLCPVEFFSLVDIAPIRTFSFVP